MNSTGEAINMLRAPAAERNKDPISEVILQYIDTQKPGFALELGSGTGQHVIHFASKFPNITWLPSDIDEPSVTSIQCYLKVYQPQNVLQPVFVNASMPAETWHPSLRPGSCDLIVCINVIHISPLAVTQGLFPGAYRMLKLNGVLITYGPYRMNGVITPESNVKFDANLKAMNPEYGLRDVEYLSKLAEENNMKVEAMHDMPANNKILVFRKVR
ncbi:methyltransferase-like 26 isoform X2 [Ptychodera flava]|uniref:methyltransferase-like 26 isoform X2 n=1 Tax=Ptychodera flava TaxID=63121 RepID=UPI00396A80AC